MINNGRKKNPNQPLQEEEEEEETWQSNNPAATLLSSNIGQSSQDLFTPRSKGDSNVIVLNTKDSANVQ